MPLATDTVPVTYRLKRTIVLIGMMGAGKTAVGGVLARKLGVPFVDQDDEIEKAANATIAEIFARDGEAFFREKESQVLGRLLAAPPCVLSTGGGAFMAERNRETIAAHGVAVWLRADLNLLWARVRHRGTRPLLQTENPYERLRVLCELRNPVYALAPIHVTAMPNYSVEMTAEAVIAAVTAHPDILEVTRDAAQR